MNVFGKFWSNLREGKKYREEIAAQFSVQAIPVQIAALMKQHGLTQTQLAERSGLTQGVISRAADTSYGKLAIRTIVRIAAGFDVAFVPLFVRFSDLPKLFARLYEEPLTVPSFEQEDRAFEERSTAASIWRPIDLAVAQGRETTAAALPSSWMLAPPAMETEAASPLLAAIRIDESSDAEKGLRQPESAYENVVNGRFSEERKWGSASFGSLAG